MTITIPFTGALGKEENHTEKSDKIALSDFILAAAKGPYIISVGSASVVRHSTCSTVLL